MKLDYFFAGLGIFFIQIVGALAYLVSWSLELIQIIVIGMVLLLINAVALILVIKGMGQ